MSIIKKIIREELQKFFEADLSEEYPQSFDMEYFKSIKSFYQRIKYCEEHLQRISSGSSRIVYKIDDEKVLKLARNKKGLAQNEVEIEYSNYSDIDSIVARVFDYHPDNMWVEMELATKLTPSKFKQITGFSWDDYCKAIYNHGIDSSNSGASRRWAKKSINKDVVDAMWEDEFVYDIFNFIGGYEVPTGDLSKTNSYGIVKRNGEDAIVMVDYGLTRDVFASHYS